MKRESKSLRIIEAKFTCSYSASIEILDYLEEAVKKSQIRFISFGNICESDMKKEIMAEINENDKTPMVILIHNIMKLTFGELNKALSWVNYVCENGSLKIIIVGPVYQKGEELFSRLNSSLQGAVDFTTEVVADIRARLLLAMDDVVTSKDYRMQYSPMILQYIWELITDFNMSVGEMMRTLTFIMFMGMRKALSLSIFFSTNSSLCDYSEILNVLKKDILNLNLLINQDFNPKNTIDFILVQITVSRIEYFNVLEILSSLILNFTNGKYKNTKMCALAHCTDDLLKEISKNDKTIVLKKIEDLEAKYSITTSLKYNCKAPTELLSHMTHREYIVYIGQKY